MTTWKIVVHVGFSENMVPIKTEEPMHTCCLKRKTCSIVLPIEIAILGYAPFSDTPKYHIVSHIIYQCLCIPCSPQ
jgi:hypothetical protein